jgi:hypothetical protein
MLSLNGYRGNVFLVRRGLFLRLTLHLATREGGSSERMLQPKLYRLEHFCEHSTILKSQVGLSVPAGNGRVPPERLGAVICSFAAPLARFLTVLAGLLSLLCRPKRDSFGCLFVSAIPLRQDRSTGQHKETLVTSCAVGFSGCHRLPGFVPAASVAESFRSRCGSVRRAPVCSSQASSVAAPQRGQGLPGDCDAHATVQ